MDNQSIDILTVEIHQAQMAGCMAVLSSTMFKSVRLAE